MGRRLGNALQTTKHMSSEQMTCTRMYPTPNATIRQLTRRDEAVGKRVDRKDVAVAGSFATPTLLSVVRIT